MMRGVALALNILFVSGIASAYPQTQYGPETGIASGLVIDVIGHVDAGLDAVGLVDAGLIDVTATGCPAYTHDCVPYYLCIDGEINTSGAGVIDVRIRPQTECTVPETPEVPGLCCRIPGATPPPTPAPLVTCPGNQVCLGEGQCPSQGVISTGVINHSCYLDQGNFVTGVCCDAPIRILDVCPLDSVCLPEILCQGDILDESNNYIPYSNAGTWSQCSLSGDVHSPGVCCRNPVVTPLPPYNPYTPANKCGVRNYGLDVRSSVKLAKNEAQFGEFPWQAVLFFSNYTFKCGASLVEDRWLITGAHCVNGYQYGDFKVRLGEWQVDKYDEPLKYVDVDIASITVHPHFNPTNLHNDVAVIELTAPVPLQYHINTVCLPSPGQFPLPGTRCFATGWGKDAFEGNYQAILKKVDVPVVEYGYCQNLLRKTRLGKYFQLDQSFMCAGGEENIDACTGDGGGPLVCEDLDSGSYFLQGITAWGINCGKKDIPGVYADVQYFRDWIDGIIYGVPVAEVNQPHPIPSYARK